MMTPFLFSNSSKLKDFNVISKTKKSWNKVMFGPFA